MISVIGLGQLYESLPLRAVYALQNAAHIVLQTGMGRCSSEILQIYGSIASTLDDVFEAAADFDELYAAGAARIAEAAGDGKSTCFACLGRPSGNGFLEQLNAMGVETKVCGETDPAAEAIFLAEDLCTIDDYVSLEAETIGGRSIDTSCGLVVTGIGSAFLASETRIALERCYPDDCQAVLVLDATAHPIALADLDRARTWFPSGVLLLPALPFETKEKYTYADALRVMEILRGTDGCPWDRQQTHDSLRPYLIEEAYEVSDAVASGDTEALADELGDVLLQIIFHSQIGNESGEFCDVDVSTALCRKMIRRHPHVFGTERAETAQDVIDNWGRIKSEEKYASERSSAMDGIPESMDPLSRAIKIQQKAGMAGLDVVPADDAATRAAERISTLMQAEEGCEAASDRTDAAGDVLYEVIDILRKLGVEPQKALQDACRRFEDKFRNMENSSEEVSDDTTASTRNSAADG